MLIGLLLVSGLFISFIGLSSKRFSDKESRVVYRDLKPSFSDSTSIRQRLRKLDELAIAYQALRGINSEVSYKDVESLNGFEGIGGPEIECNDDGKCLEIIDSAYFYSKFPKQPFEISKAKTQEEVDALIESYVRFFSKVPLEEPANGFIRSGFGKRLSPFSRRVSFHEGVDFAVPYGSEVLVTGNGVVSEVKWSRSYGLMVEVTHGSGFVTRYAHLSKAMVKEGQEVCTGQRIGLVGSTGRSTGPHLHYEVLAENKYVDPLKMLEIGYLLKEII